MSSEANEPNATRLRFFVAVSPGLEPWLVDELRSLGLAPELRAGGVELSGSFAEMIRVCMRSRLSESVRVRVKNFKATGFDVLEKQLQRLPWHAYLRPELATHISVTCHRSRLYHSNAVLERCQRAVEASLKTTLRITSRAEADQTVFVRLDRDQVEVSIDASGDLLHRRGYRTHMVNAPLRETLAAALVRIAQKDKASPSAMWDPFCGSGTVMLEWLAAAQGYTPIKRGFAFEKWPTFRPHATSFAETCTAQNAITYRAGERHAFGSDINERATSAALSNADHLGARPDVDVAQCDFAEMAAQVPKGSVIITNPPYGKRLGNNRDVLALYRRFEQLLKTRRDLRPVVMACGCLPFVQTMTLPWKPIATISNGGLKVVLLRLE